MLNLKTVQKVGIGVAVGSLVLRAFALIAKATPTKKDDAISNTANLIFQTITGVNPVAGDTQADA